MRYRNNWAQLDAFDTQAQPKVAEMMWSRTDLKPADVDIAQLYDGFTSHTLNRLENFGFCQKYEAGDFIEGGTRIALDGALPVNTGGGALSGGRLHAYGAVHEACTQLWGRGGQRQGTASRRSARLPPPAGRSPGACCWCATSFPAIPPPAGLRRHVSRWHWHCASADASG